MKRFVRPIFFTATLLLSLAAVAVAQDDGACSNAIEKGTWGYTLTGTLILPAPTGAVPFAVVGRTSNGADGSGTGTQTSSLGGQTTQDTTQSTFTVDPDCTATFSVSVYDQSGHLLRKAQFTGVFVDDASELRAIMTSLTIATPNGMVSVPAIVTMTGKKLFLDSGNQQ